MTGDDLPKPGGCPKVAALKRRWHDMSQDGQDDDWSAMEHDHWQADRLAFYETPSPDLKALSAKAEFAVWYAETCGDPAGALEGLRACAANIRSLIGTADN